MSFHLQSSFVVVFVCVQCMHVCITCHMCVCVCITCHMCVCMYHMPHVCVCVSHATCVFVCMYHMPHVCVCITCHMCVCVCMYHMPHAYCQSLYHGKYVSVQCQESWKHTVLNGTIPGMHDSVASDMFACVNVCVSLINRQVQRDYNTERSLSKIANNQNLVLF